MVALSVFGREFGVQRQSLVVILLLLGCIVLEIVGQPFRYMKEAPWLLEKMEITALLVEFGTLWCGLMIYESGPESEGMNVVMTTCVVAANAGLMAWFLFVLFRAYAQQTKDSRIVQRIRMSIGRDQVSIHRRTFDANDSRNIDNPLDGVEMMKAKKKRFFERYETEDGEEFFVEVGKDESVWDLPSDGEVVPG